MPLKPWNGVNIAARVQAQPKPGGICISQVGYGVVKNKIKLDVVRFEARKLQNISESIQIYQVLLEPPAPLPTVSQSPIEIPTAGISNGSRSLLLFVLLALRLTGAGLFLYHLHREPENELAGSQATRNALGAALPPRNPTESTGRNTRARGHSGQSPVGDLHRGPESCDGRIRFSKADHGPALPPRVFHRSRIGWCG